MRRVLLSAALSFALPAAGFAASGAMPATTPMPAKGAAAPAAKFAMVAFIGAMTGSAQVQIPGSDVWMMAKVGQQIPGGAQIKSGPDSTVTVGFTDGSKISLGANAVFKVEEVSNGKIALFIGLGRLDAWVAKLKGRAFQVRNPVSVASVRGTSFSSIVYQGPSGFRAETFCFTGALAVADSFGRVQAVGAGQTVAADPVKGAAEPTLTPPSVVVPVEPVVEVPAALAAVAAPETVPAETPAEVAAEEAPAPTEPAVINNPLQETTTASPSAP